MSRFITFKSIVLSIALSATVCLAAFAEPDLGAVARHQAVLDLGTDLRLMCVAAHPDDEDGATLAMYRKRYGYKTSVVLATRGEGGQNEIGPELYEELAVLRTQEMMRASAITGAELHFLDLPEFGYSKTREETFELWGYENALERMVRKIRLLRPDVIITHHGPTGGHGHHQAIGKVLLDAFDLAADPEVFPEHMDEGLEPWQPARLFQRSFGGGAQYEIDFNALDPVRGYTYAEIAAQALREHETQGMGFFIDRFLTSRSRASYGLVKEAGDAQGAGTLQPPGGALFEGMHDRVSKDARDVSLKGAGQATLADALKLLRDAGGPEEADRANRLAVVLSEIELTAKLSDTEVIAGQNVSIQVEAIDFGEKNATDIAFNVEPAPWFPAAVDGTGSQSFSSEGFSSTTLNATVPANQPRTTPHHEFVFSDEFYQPQLTVTGMVELDGTPVRLEAPLLLDVMPRASVEFVGGPYLVRPDAQRGADIKLLVTNHAPGPQSTRIIMIPTDGVEYDRSSIPLEFDAEGDQKIVPVQATLRAGAPEGDYQIMARVDATNYANISFARVAKVAVPKNKNVGVVLSYDDTFVTTLQRLGVPHEALDIDDFLPERLDEFTTIIVDIRAYLVRPDLVANNQALLDYVERGGSMIVMYQKTFEWNSEYAPYELQLSRARVTREDAPIDVLHPEHPLFTTPNRIVDSDWDGWRQERGLYFPSRWADEYTSLIGVADPGESPPPGSVLVARHGNGMYMYTALGWYRQLRELHPGTLRIFANMLAL